ncbi:MAG: DsbA family protein [Bacteroidota bacterium]
MGKSNLAKPKLIYVCDSSCGWCYGFSPVIERLHGELYRQYQFEVLPVGMVMRNRNGLVQDVLSYLKWSHKCIEKSTNIRFGEDFLNKALKEGKVTMDSYKPAIAMTVFRSYQPKKLINFSIYLQKAIFFNGMDPSNWSSYEQCAEDHNIDGVEFVECMKTLHYQRVTNKTIKKARRLNVSQFPTIVLEKGGKTTTISEGYLGYDALRQRIEKEQFSEEAVKRRAY